jgi:hypothetical protein
MKKGGGSGGVAEVQAAQCLVDLGGAAAVAKGDEVVRVETNDAWLFRRCQR